MKIGNFKKLAALTFALAFLSCGITNAQTPNAYGYSTGYGTVYGSFGLASTMQSMYNVSRAQMQRSTARNAMIKKWGLAAVEKAEREAGSRSSTGTKTSAPSNPEIFVPPPPVVRNHGVYRPDPSVDTGKALADNLGDTPEEKALIKRIYAATKAGYEKEAALKGWQNNIAAGLTFFTVTAMTVYHDAEEPSDEAVNTYYKVMNVALDEMPELATVASKDKQAFNNMLIGFSGMQVAVYLEAKQNNDADALATSKKLAGMLIEMILKTDPENLRIENGQIVMK
ncbi:MAG: hypothetical protein ND895_14305 [Pyrinomonadaceae bacterium]|nr:hypothetical protein [Pyrinomonadaceae bacterium]